MGLDVTAYRDVTFLRAEPLDDDDGHDAGQFRLYVNRHFPERADGLADGIYSYAEEFDFCAGSYTGYNEWRNALAIFAGYASDKDCWDNGPSASGEFYELIQFADNEGTIGPKTSAKLAADFARNQECADQHPEEWFPRKYAQWRRAFELAANSGAVTFH